MLSSIPSFRHSTLEHWSSLFSKERQGVSVEVCIHSVPIEFHVPSESLAQELKGFFSNEPSRHFTSPIFVDWREPKAELIHGHDWDEVRDPNCFFHDSFISQRDFLAYKTSSSSYQLMAPAKLDDGLFNFLRYLLPLHLLKQQRVLFHSSTVLDENEKAYVFFGPSGAGKTTISQLCRGASVLGDDMNILSIQKGELHVEGAALGQRFFDRSRAGTSFPVKKLFWIKQSKKLKVDPLDGGPLKYLLSSFANLFWDQLSAAEYKQVFQALNQIRSHKIVQELCFPKSEEVWSYVREL